MEMVMEGVWMQITFCLDTDRFKILKRKAEQKAVRVSELVHEIVCASLAEQPLRTPRVLPQRRIGREVVLSGKAEKTDASF